MRLFGVTFLVLAAILAVPAPTSAASCALTSAVLPGHSITITGTGFQAGATVEITQVWSGSNAALGGNTGPLHSQIQATPDSSGEFTYTIDAGPGHGGTYDVSATDGMCTATTQVAALETAGGVNPGGPTGQPMPATDTVPAEPTGDHLPIADVLALGAVMSTFGIGFVLRASRRSAGR